MSTMDIEDSYPLTRGLHQLVRVHLLQQLWTDTNGYYIHPAVESKEPSAFRIADVATASGLWLCELSRSQADAEKYDLNGFDVSPQSFIPNQRLPKNVKLHVLDAHKSPPEEFKHQFDLVHVRLLQPAITDNNPKWVIKHCMELLRPGGYLQWEEFDPMSMSVCDDHGDVSGLQRSVEVLHDRAPSRWIEAIPQHLAESGMEVIAVERKSPPAFHQAIVTYQHCLVLDEYTSHMKGEEGAEMRKMVQTAYDDAQEGSHVDYLFQTVVSRKSS